MSTIDDAEIKIEYNKHNIIYVCGPDHTGKTEISKALAQKINGTRFKASSEHDMSIFHAQVQSDIAEELAKIEGLNIAPNMQGVTTVTNMTGISIDQDHNGVLDDHTTTSSL